MYGPGQAEAKPFRDIVLQLDDGLGVKLDDALTFSAFEMVMVLPLESTLEDLLASRRRDELQQPGVNQHRKHTIDRRAVVLGYHSPHAVHVEMALDAQSCTRNGVPHVRRLEPLLSDVRVQTLQAAFERS